MYLTFDEYQVYGGTLDETTFNEYNFEAESLINYFTFNRLVNESEISENIKRCAFKLISIAKQRADAFTLGASADGSTSTGASITSQSNDGVSVSYNALSASQLFESSQVEMESLVNRYLQGVKNSLGQLVLYRGIYPNE